MRRKHVTAEKKLILLNWRWWNKNKKKKWKTWSQHKLDAVVQWTNKNQARQISPNSLIQTTPVRFSISCCGKWQGAVRWTSQQMTSQLIIISKEISTPSPQKPSFFTLIVTMMRETTSQLHSFNPIQTMSSLWCGGRNGNSSDILTTAFEARKTGVEGWKLISGKVLNHHLSIHVIPSMKLSAFPLRLPFHLI